MAIKVYLAGKISDPERAKWRRKLLDIEAPLTLDRSDAATRDYAHGGEASPASLAYPCEPNCYVLGKYEYVGPYRICAWPQEEAGGHTTRVDLDSGQAGAEHGAVGLGQHGQMYFGKVWQHGGSVIFRECMAAVKRCDILVAYLDGDDLHGTLIEIGWALAWSKVVILVNGAGHYGSYGDLLAHADALWVDDDPKTIEFALLNAVRVVERRGLPTMPYSEYLKTAHWQDVRQAALGRAVGRCQLCGARDRLNVHHNTYERRGRELASDVIVLCRSCHAKHHDIVGNGQRNR